MEERIAKLEAEVSSLKKLVAIYISGEAEVKIGFMNDFQEELVESFGEDEFQRRVENHRKVVDYLEPMKI